MRFFFEQRKSLVLADLDRAALKSPGLNVDISASADCSVCAAWAKAIHRASPRWDGIRYASRRMNQGFACASFKRSGRRKLKTEKPKARHVDHFCVRFIVTAV